MNEKNDYTLILKPCKVRVVPVTAERQPGKHYAETAFGMLLELDFNIEEADNERSTTSVGTGQSTGRATGGIATD
jgi:hypothetical protein